MTTPLPPSFNLCGDRLLNNNRQRAFLKGAPLQRASLKGASLPGASLHRAYLTASSSGGILKIVWVIMIVFRPLDFAIVWVSLL